MHYIVVDLEWNQPVSYQSSVYRKVGDKLIFEMIQIGAVKLDEAFQIVDSISIPIHPTHYIKIHPRIKRMTHLGPEELEDAPTFMDAMKQFDEWCGADCALLTWGCDDVSVLKQNVDFFGWDKPIPPAYDIQVLFSQAFQLGKDRKGLKAAMEMVEVEEEAERSFHNALHDAYYTARVWQKLPEPGKVMNHPQTAKVLIHERRGGRMRCPAKAYDSLAKAFEAANVPKCSACGKEMAMEGEYVYQTGDKYVGIAACHDHGQHFVRLRLEPSDDNKVFMGMQVEPLKPLSRAYVLTKRLCEHRPQDLEGALQEAGRSSMPFDD